MPESRVFTPAELALAAGLRVGQAEFILRGWVPLGVVEPAEGGYTATSRGLELSLSLTNADPGAVEK